MSPWFVSASRAAAAGLVGGALAALAAVLVWPRDRYQVSAVRLNDLSALLVRLDTRTGRTDHCTILFGDRSHTTLWWTQIHDPSDYEIVTNPPAKSATP